jgi:hypothetical protein
MIWTFENPEKEQYIEVVPPMVPSETRNNKHIRKSKNQYLEKKI